ncbi:MAG: glycosyltransferase family 4 protein [Planctomycetaceae bacterium]|nr:glycosyltransferase family 4 protein [Planctomycetales bacterium]MCB9874936.1 glycosyltransferase family 4 protein [Planctomycetaceae bacterium]MCB9923792.1 glycosyltransferase family 4 protein [Planctomycetaceae bacterium]
MKVLLCHNYYQQPGGEDRSFFDEEWLLKSHGHEVIRYTIHNDVIEGMSSIRLAKKLIWNHDSYRELRQLIRRERPAVMHCTNTFPLISPSVYYAAKREGVPVIQSLHNYRLLCPNALFLRNGQACESCLGKVFPLPAILHGCYRDSRVASTGVATMVAFHRLMRTWSRAIDKYFVLTEFARDKFIQGGIAADKMVIKPNFVHPDTGPGNGSGEYAIFVGRLSTEKGIETLLEAWNQLPANMRLRVVGDGPMAGRVSQAMNDDPRIEWVGRRTKEEVDSMINKAACLVIPSLCYETFGRAIIEAYVHGVPVIASRHGAMAELVRHGETGWLFETGNASELRRAIERTFSDPRKLREMRVAARRAYENLYTAEANYDLLISAYNEVIVSVPQPVPQRSPVIKNSPVEAL